MKKIEQLENEKYCCYRVCGSTNIEIKFHVVTKVVTKEYKVYLAHNGTIPTKKEVDEYTKEINNEVS